MYFNKEVFFTWNRYNLSGRAPASRAHWPVCTQIPSQIQTLEGGDMVLITIDRLFALFGKRGIVIFARGSCGLDKTSVNNLSCFELKALFSKLALKFVKTFAVKVHRFEVGTETGDSRVVRDRVESSDAQEAAVEEIAFETG